MFNKEAEKKRIMVLQPDWKTVVGPQKSSAKADVLKQVSEIKQRIKDWSYEKLL